MKNRLAIGCQNKVNLPHLLVTASVWWSLWFASWPQCWCNLCSVRGCCQLQYSQRGNLCPVRCDLFPKSCFYPPCCYFPLWWLIWLSFTQPWCCLPFSGLLAQWERSSQLAQLELVEKLLHHVQMLLICLGGMCISCSLSGNWRLCRYLSRTWCLYLMCIHAHRQFKETHIIVW